MATEIPRVRASSVWCARHALQLPRTRRNGLACAVVLGFRRTGDMTCAVCTEHGSYFRRQARLNIQEHVRASATHGTPHVVAHHVPHQRRAMKRVSTRHNAHRTVAAVDQLPRRREVGYAYLCALLEHDVTEKTLCVQHHSLRLSAAIRNTRIACYAAM